MITLRYRDKDKDKEYIWKDIVDGRIDYSQLFVNVHDNISRYIIRIPYNNISYILEDKQDNPLNIIKLKSI